MEVFVIFPVFIILAIVFRLIAGGMDHDRIDQYISELGGEVIARSWDPFGKGWYGDKKRIYQLRYQDSEGNIHQATCKTSVLSGVYLTEDHIINYSEQSIHNRTEADLLEENRRLRQEIENLKKRDEC